MPASGARSHAAQVRARSPSRLAATVTFDRVRPEATMLVDRGADARDVGAAPLAPGRDGLGARRRRCATTSAVRLRCARRDAVDRPVEREAVEIVADRDLPRGADEARRGGTGASMAKCVRAMSATGRPVRCADEHDVGRRDEIRQGRDARARVVRHALVGQARGRASSQAPARGGSSVSARPRSDLGDAGPVGADDARRGSSPLKSTLRMNQTIRLISRSCRSP